MAVLIMIGLFGCGAMILLTVLWLIPLYAKRKVCAKYGHDWTQEVVFKNMDFKYIRKCTFCGKRDSAAGPWLEEVKWNKGPSLPIIRPPMKVKAEVEFLDEPEGSK